MAATIDDRVTELERANAQLRRQLDACSAELNEAREQQTATAEVLQVINASPGDLAPVFDAMLDKAIHLCDAAFGTFWTREGESFRAVALHRVPAAFADLLRKAPYRPEPGSHHERLMQGEPFSQTVDIAAETWIGPVSQALVEQGSARSVIAVSLRKDGVLLGVISAYRQEVRPFTDKQIALLQNFAAQAVIAMENARLLTETREALDQQTATAEVLQVINSSPGNLAPVFDAILEKAHKLCDVSYGSLELYDGTNFHAVATIGYSDTFADLVTRGYVGAASPDTRALIEGERFAHILDLAATDALMTRTAAQLEGHRTLLCVPLRREDQLLGMIATARKEVRAFSDKDIALLENFAAQAVIAMENARLLTETREALDQQTATAEVLQVINSSPGDLTPVFDAVLDKATRLCDAAFGTLWTYDGERFKAVALRQVPEGYAEFLAQAPLRPVPFSGLGRVAAGESAAHFYDVSANEAYRGGDPALRALLELGKARSTVAVPLCKDNTVLGAITAYRQEVRPFTDKQIALLQNFAAQAVIAMENARLITETREALEQQTATAEVLQVINSSPGDLAPVFEAMLNKATRLCEAAHGQLATFDGKFFRFVAVHGDAGFVEGQQALGLLEPSYGVTWPRIVAGEHCVHIPDVRDTELFRADHDSARRFAGVGRGRSLLTVALRKDQTLLGTLTVYRQEVRPFSEKEIALVENFAAQAVIAMENARLLTETREALEQQTATAEVLQVINSSPGDLAPVFDAVLERATRLCGAAYGHLWTYDGEFLHPFVSRGQRDIAAWFHRAGPRRPSPDEPLGRVLAGEHFVQITDALIEEGYKVVPEIYEQLRLNNIRTILLIPLRKEDVALGVFVVYRQEVRSFTGKQIALLQNFAAQAVIAMENARLLTETREALEQQTATAEVLQVINSSPGDLAPVFDAMLAKALHLCGAPYGILWNYDGEFFEVAAQRGVPKAFLDTMSGPQRPTSPETTRGRLVAGEHVVHITNLGADLLYQSGDQHRRALVDAAGAQVVVAVSLRKDDRLLGAFTIYRQEARPFSDKQIALVTTFADQAVIAMENARLITETREALEQQTATAEVLQVINSSPGDLAPVFDAILEKAHVLCGAAYGGFMTYDGGAFRVVAAHGEARFVEHWQQGPIRPPEGTPLARVMHGEAIAHVADVLAEDYYRNAPALARLIDLGGIRTFLIVPLRRDDVLLGVITAYRQEVRPFSEKQIALLQNFAAQAVIAMENARLITETREALEQQTATAEVLQVINSSPGDLAPVFDAMIRKAVRLCGAVQGSLRTFDGEALHLAAWHGAPSFAERARELGPIVLRPGHPMEPLLRGQRIVHLTDGREATANSEDSAVRERVATGNIRSWLAVALRTDGGLLGSIAVSRQEVLPFTDKQITLLENFAAQAVIAMENARLLTETREALEAQTATAEVLQVINSSPGDLVPVFDAILEKAHALCDAPCGSLQIFDGELFRAVATRGLPEAYATILRRGVRSTGVDPGAIVQSDYAERLARSPDNQNARIAVEVAKLRTVLFVPLRKDDVLVGRIAAGRQDARPFTDKQIALLQNFAAQAVIAMENARLLTETREALEQQTATAEVLQVINSSPGDLSPVFDAMLDKAMRLCNAAFGYLMTYDGERFQEVAHQGLPPRFAEYLPRMDQPGSSGAYARIKGGARLVHIADLMEGDVYRTSPLRQALVDLGGARTGIVIALRKDETLLGVLTIYRQEVRPFSEKQIALLQNFAAQAVIAMENARLITETREALEQQTATADVLQVINSSPGDLAPVFDAMLEKAMRLCEADVGNFWTYDGEAFTAVAMRDPRPEQVEWARHRRRGGPGSISDSLIRGESVIHIPDAADTDAYRAGEPTRRAIVDLNGGRTLLAVALRKGDELLGYITIFRRVVRPFSDKQIALLQNFAAQAVIAMENARLLTETREALEQQTATAEVLQVINSSPGDLAPVFDAILEKAHSLCDIAQGSLELYDGERFRAVAVRGLSDEFAEMLRQGSPASDNPATRPLIEGERFSYIADMAASDYPVERTAAATEGVRTLLCVPLRREGQLLGMIASARKEMRPFSEKEIALLENFAAQAVIAMENARLLTETREALEQQTATAELLEVINSSPGDLAPVFDAMLEKAMRLCRIALGALELHENGKFRAVAVRGVSGPLAELLRQPFEPPQESPLARLIAGEKVVQITDMSELARLRPDDPRAQAGAQYGLHTALFVPLRKDAELLGQVVAFRQELRPFSEKEIALLENFAAQAVIAMENARLLNELRQRTRDLQESLEYQTATSDVLKVISQSGSEIEPVLETLLETAARICEADKGVITRLQNGLYRAAASFGFPAEYEDLMARSPIAPGRGSCVGRTALERRIVHIEDAATDPEFTWTESQQLGQLRTMLGVPLFREDALIGVISLARSRVEPFTEKQIALVRTFADQAVIAIENARLFNELRERTAELGRSVEELKMLGEVGRAVSSTLDLRAVLSTILTASLGMTWATAGAIFRYIRAERAFRLVEAVGWDEALLGSVGDLSIAETETVMSEAASRRTPIQLTDLAELPSTRLRDASLAAGLRSVLIVPLVGPERIFGALVLQRREAGEFPAETVRLMQTLASQSVLAIQNARLFREIADKSEQLALASEHKSQFLANMSHELRTPLNAILGYAELLVDGIYGVLPEKAQGVLERVQNNGKHLLALINDVLDLAKIEAGQLALTLEDYVLAEVVRSVVTATEPLAAAKGLKFTAIVQDGMPMAHGDARRVSQVLLNLAGNAIKFTDAGEVEINASAANGQFLLTVRDTGPGIADADQERIFGEFQQIENTDTRKKGGTGLGLAISKRMVEMQGGMISVDSTVGEGSTFRVVLPVQVEPAMEEAA